MRAAPLAVHMRELRRRIALPGHRLRRHPLAQQGPQTIEETSSAPGLRSGVRAGAPTNADSLPCAATHAIAIGDRRADAVRHRAQLLDQRKIPVEIRALEARGEGAEVALAGARL